MEKKEKIAEKTPQKHTACERAVELNRDGRMNQDVPMISKTLVRALLLQLL